MKKTALTMGGVIAASIFVNIVRNNRDVIGSLPFILSPLFPSTSRSN